MVMLFGYFIFLEVLIWNLKCLVVLVNLGPKTFEILIPLGMSSGQWQHRAYFHFDLSYSSLNALFYTICFCTRNVLILS